MITLSSLRNPADLARSTASIALFCIPQDIMTRSTIRPAQIETFSHVDVRTLESAADRDAFFAALEASAPALGRDAAEFRIKAVFLDAAGARLGELYASAIAPYGMLGDETLLTFASPALTQFVTGAVAVSETR